MADDLTYALVTGAASGIGEAIALELLGAGAIVAGLDIQKAKLEEIARAYPDRFVPIAADAMKEDEVCAAIAETQHRCGRLTRAFNVVGGGRLSPLLNAKLDDWSHTTNLTLTSTFLCIREEALIMKDLGGAIVNIASLNAHMPAHGFAAYASSKAAVEMLTKSAALELMQYDIRVNAVLPGLTLTSATQPLLGDPDVLAKFMERIPARRAAEA